jgi:pimeloyl-ACP methyl ester carboxylesterase
VSRLVLASTLASADSFPSETRERALRMFELFGVDWDSPIVRSMAVEWLFPGTDEVVRRIMSEFFHRSGDGANVSAFLIELMRIDATQLAAQIRVPTLVIHGRDDQPVPLEAGREIASLVPGARFEIVAGGHLEGTGGSPESQQLILDFLADGPQQGVKP